MERLKSHVTGQWFDGEGEGSTLVNPTTEAPLASTSTSGLPFQKTVEFARQVGGPTLRKMTFLERGAILKQMSAVLHEQREHLIDISIANGGTTRKDAKFDIDGATGTLAAYARWAKELGETTFIVEGPGEPLTRSPRFCGYHIKKPKEGVAIHINAFNFPAWGMCEKAACALLAGMPVVTKPATSTSHLAYAMVKIWVEADLLPAGALQLICGSPGDLLDHVGPQDVVAFTGSADTGARIRRTEAIIAHSVPVNVEADSLNAAVLGHDVDLDSEAYGLFLQHMQLEITQKAGQKCTATRRIFVPAAHIDQVQADLIEKIEEIRMGAPDQERVRLGPLATAQQLADARSGVQQLVESGARIVFGSTDPVTLDGVESGKGFFMGPVLLRADSPQTAAAVHAHEVFAPVSTLMPYEDTADVIAWVAMGGGGLVTSVYSDDRDWCKEAVLGLAPYHGRIFLGNSKAADQATTPGMVLPQSIHGGPGRAGGGEELGGLRGLDFYTQRTAIQGDRGVLDRILGAPRAKEAGTP
jgi:3,4-dehydroadipyl-CoA semialdehyde dehydrogenase